MCCAGAGGDGAWLGGSCINKVGGSNYFIKGINLIVVVRRLNCRFDLKGAD